MKIGLEIGEARASHAGEEAEEKEPLTPPVGAQTGPATMGSCVEGPQNTENGSTQDPAFHS